MLIAEISNCHFGSLKKAKELIKAAHNSGADLIKAQAFLPKDIKSGSMPFWFYEQCAFAKREYIELIEYAREIGNDLFYSIFSEELIGLGTHQKWHKITGAQTLDGKATEMMDLDNVLISVPGTMDLDQLYPFIDAELLYVSPYMVEDPKLELIDTLSAFVERPVGYSDHTVGIKQAIRAAHFHNVHIIEKHFCLTSGDKWNGQIYRDTVHGVTPNEFEKLAKLLS